MGAGARVIKPIAAPMVGRMVASTVLTLLVVPAIWSVQKQRDLARVFEPDASPRGSVEPEIIRGTRVANPTQSLISIWNS